MESTGKIVSILAGTYEGKIYEEDLALEHNYTLLRTRAQFASLTTLALDGFAEKHPEMAFLHIFPGKVKTGFLARGVKSAILKMLLGYIVEPIMTIGGIDMHDCGERMIWMALDEQHAKGIWSLDFDGSESQSEELTRYRQDRPLRQRIRMHDEQVFARATTAI